MTMADPRSAAGSTNGAGDRRKRVLVADRNVYFREYVRDVLWERADVVLFGADTAEEVFEHFKVYGMTFDLLVVGPHFTDQQQLHLLQEIRDWREGQDLAIAFILNREKDRRTFLGMRTPGKCAFISKGLSPQELGDRLLLGIAE